MNGDFGAKITFPQDHFRSFFFFDLLQIFDGDLGHDVSSRDGPATVSDYLYKSTY
jgi:hypothetical protein